MQPHKQQGVEAVELAIILPIMLILCFGITELGRALYLYNGLVKATRGAARYLSQQNLASPPAGETADSLRLKARNLALCGVKNCSNADPLVPGLTLEQISVCDGLACAASHNNIAVPGLSGYSVNLVSVTIGSSAAYNFASAVPWVIPDIAFAPVKTTVAALF